MDARLNLKWLISIVPRGRGNAVAQICNENHIAVQLLAQARGTASSDIQLVLGLGEPGKDMVMSLVPGAVLPRLLPALSRPCGRSTRCLPAQASFAAARWGRIRKCLCIPCVPSRN